MSKVAENKDNKARVTVKIFGEDYVVKGPVTREYIEMLAAYVDKRMRQISQRNLQLSQAKVAVLTALNLADELVKLQEDYDGLIKLIEEEKGK